MRSVFCGRDEELKLLAGAFARVAVERSGPELIVLLAEAGLGKTRLAQEFFARLSTTHDGTGGAGYWPDELGQERSNLKINPKPSECVIGNPLPFLWWGVRLDDPGARNAITSGAVRGHMEELLPHLEPMEHARRQAARKVMAAKTGGAAVAEAALDLIPGVSFAKTAIKAMTDLWKLRNEAKADQAPRSIDDTRDRQRHSLVDTLLDALASLMRPSEYAPGVPGVILFDDAQFSPADPSATELFTKLLERALRERWPLLILVTHWQREWSADHIPAAVPGDPSSIAGAIHAALPRLTEGWRPLKLQPISNLAPVLRQGLPGLPPEQSAALLERAGGNPRYLEQMVLLARGRARYFAGRDIAGAMTDEGFQKFSAETVDMKATVEQRLADAGEGVRRAVALASLQGMRFVRSLAVHMGSELGLNDVEPGLEAAERPHGIVSTIDSDVADFVQRIFHEVATEALPDVADPEAARTVLAGSLRWAADSMLPTAGATADTELLRILAANLFENAPDADDRKRAMTCLHDLMQAERESHDFLGAKAYAERLWTGVKDGRWSADDLGIPRLWNLNDALKEMGRYDDAITVTGHWSRLAYDAVAADNTPANQRTVAAAVMAMGDLMMVKGKPKRAAECFMAAAPLTEALDRLSGTPDSRRNVALTFERLGNVVNATEGPAKAREAYQRSLDIREELAKELGTPQARRDLAVSYDRLGSVIEATDGHAKASYFCQKCLDVTEKLAEELRTPQALEDLAMSLERLGSIISATDGPDKSRERYQRSLDIRKKLADELGTPNALEDLAVGLNLLGDVIRATEGIAKARDSYQKSADIRAKLAEELGTPKARRDLSVSLDRLGDVVNATQGPAKAREYFQQSLDIRAKLAEQLRTPQSRRDLAVSHSKLAQLLAEAGDFENALAPAISGLEIRKMLEAELATPGSASDLSDVHLSIHNIFAGLDRNEKALEHLEAAIAAAGLYQLRSPGHAANAKMQVLQMMKNLHAGPEDQDVPMAKMLLLQARGDRAIAINMARTGLQKMRATLAETPSKHTEGVVQMLEDALRELEGGAGNGGDDAAAG